MEDFKFNKLVEHISEQAQKGTPMILAGIIFWILALIANFVLPSDIIVWFYLFGIGAVFPLGILISKVLKINFLANDNPLSVIGGLIGGIQVFFAPLIILVALNQPDWIPFVVGILTGAHFLPYVSIYDSRAYLFQTVATVGIVTVVGFSWMTQSYLFIPIALIVVYTITYVLLRSECKVGESDQKRMTSA